MQGSWVGEGPDGEVFETGRRVLAAGASSGCSLAHSPAGKDL